MNDSASKSAGMTIFGILTSLIALINAGVLPDSDRTVLSYTISEWMFIIAFMVGAGLIISEAISRGSFSMLLKELEEYTQHELGLRDKEMARLTGAGREAVMDKAQSVFATSQVELPSTADMLIFLQDAVLPTPASRKRPKPAELFFDVCDSASYVELAIDQARPANLRLQEFNAKRTILAVIFLIVLLIIFFWR